MIFLRIGRSVNRSSRSAFYNTPFSGGYGVELAVLNGLAPENACIARSRGGSGFMRSYLTSIGAGKQVLNGGASSEFNSVFANPGLIRLYRSETQKKRNYENYYPKNKKEIPKGNNQKGEHKEDSRMGDQGNNQDFSTKFQSFVAPLLLPEMALPPPLTLSAISFQEFKNKLLEPGLVDHILVSNKSVAKIYVKSSPPGDNQTSGDTLQGSVGDTNDQRKVSHYKYYFTIGSVESFEEKLEEAQEALGIDPHNFIPVTCVSETNWLHEFMKFAPTVLLLGTLFYMGHRMQGGIGVRGPGGKGARGIFNIGKAHFTKMDKNAKNKVFFKDMAGCDEAKQEIMEFVHFLKNPKKYEVLGAKIPKGPLCRSSRNRKDITCQGNCWRVWRAFSFHFWVRFHGNVCRSWPGQSSELISRGKTVCAEYSLY